MGRYAGTGARGKFKTNMADSSVELIEFFRPHKNEVNLYVTNISRQLEKEVVQVGISFCIICFAIIIHNLFNRLPYLWYNLPDKLRTSNLSLSLFKKQCNDFYKKKSFDPYRQHATWM